MSGSRFEGVEGQALGTRGSPIGRRTLNPKPEPSLNPKPETLNPKP